MDASRRMRCTDSLGTGKAFGNPTSRHIFAIEPKESKKKLRVLKFKIP